MLGKAAAEQPNLGQSGFGSREGRTKRQNGCSGARPILYLSMATSNHITMVLEQMRSGNPKSSAELLPLVYEDLRAMARKHLSQERPGQTLQPTALVHEAYIRLLGSGDDVQWDDRRHFFGAAAIAMRRVLVERARARASIKRGGPDARRVTLSENDTPLVEEPDADEMLAIEDALVELEASDGRKAQIVMLRFFAGLSMPETARALDMDLNELRSEWAFTRAWMLDRISGQRDGGT